MLKLDRAVAFVILLFSSGYAWLAFKYELLPFERNMDFKPNTMPLGLAAIGIVLSLAILFAPRPKESSVLDESTVDERDLSEPAKEYDRVRPILLVVLMIFYALLLRPAGFIIATSGFLIFSAIILGERKLHILLSVAIGSSVLIWYLVQELLGIYLNPWPVLLNGG